VWDARLAFLTHFLDIPILLVMAAAMALNSIVTRLYPTHAMGSCFTVWASCCV
jgi:hypothetical protein